MRNVKITFAVGVALMLVVGAVVLTRAPPRVVRAAVSPASSIVGTTSGEPTICQTNEVLPSGVSGIRFAIWAFLGSSVHATALSGSQVLTEGGRNAAWTSTSVTVPVKPLDHATANARVCLAFKPNSEPMIVLGGPVAGKTGAVVFEHQKDASGAPTGTGHGIQGRMNIEYLAAGRGSWWSRAVSVARHIGLGHVVSGTWIALLLAALMAGVGVLAIRLTLREIQ